MNWYRCHSCGIYRRPFNDSLPLDWQAVPHGPVVRHFCGQGCREWRERQDRFEAAVAAEVRRNMELLRTMGSVH